jgi:hypothetical protein
VSVPSGWTTYRSGQRVVHVGVRSLLDPGRTVLWDVAGDSSDTVARSLAWYHHTIGVPFQMTAGVSGCALLRSLHPDPRRGRSPYWGKSVDAEPADIRPAGDILWTRRASTLERARPYVHGFDLRAARLAAAGVADLPWDRSGVQSGAAPFDPTLAGFWAVRSDQLPDVDERRPPLWEPSGEPLTWLSAPIAGELWKRGQLPEVLDSRTAPARQWLRSWSTRLGAARLAAETEPGAPERWSRSVKATYAETVGMMMRRGGSIYRPDVAAQIIDRQRVTLLAHADRVAGARGEYPVAAMTDCLYYTSDFADPADAAADLGIPLAQPGRLGGFRPYAVHHMTEWLDTVDAEAGVAA